MTSTKLRDFFLPSSLFQNFVLKAEVFSDLSSHSPSVRASYMEAPEGFSAAYCTCMEAAAAALPHPTYRARDRRPVVDAVACHLLLG